MSKRHRIQIGLFFLLPIIGFLIPRYCQLDLYLSITISYLVLLIITKFIDIDVFLHVPSLMELWIKEKETEKEFVFGKAIFTPPIIKVSPVILLEDANLFNAAKLKYLLGETGAFISSTQNEFTRIIGFNIILLIALMIFTPREINSSKENSGLREQFKIEKPMAYASFEKINPPNINNKENPTTENVQLRFLMSYFAVAIQLVWFGRAFFHYKQKNADLYFQKITTFQK